MCDGGGFLFGSQEDQRLRRDTAKPLAAAQSRIPPPSTRALLGRMAGAVRDPASENYDFERDPWNRCYASSCSFVATERTIEGPVDRKLSTSLQHAIRARQP